MDQKQEKRTGVIIGGSGLLGGTLIHFFKKFLSSEVDIYAPNSKKLNLQDPEDINFYLNKFKPDFVINAAIASLDSDPQLAFEVNYLGCVNLALKAQELNVPYIHLSSAATLPSGLNLTEEDSIDLTPDLSNYAKSKLMAEMTLQHLYKTRGLDYTIIRLGVVYGKYDHKIQGFHRLFFSIIDREMPVMLTKLGVLHSYTNAAKLPFFVDHILRNRVEFSGQIYNFVDRNPVELAQLILTIKNYMELSIPKEIYVPCIIAKGGKVMVEKIIWLLARIGVKARMPAELMFLDNFYQTQTMSCEKLKKSSFSDPAPEKTIFTELPDLIQYYLTRWEHLNLISFYNKEFFDPTIRAEEFLRSPKKLLNSIHEGDIDPFACYGDQCDEKDGRYKKH